MVKPLGILVVALLAVHAAAQLEAKVSITGPDEGTVTVDHASRFAYDVRNEGEPNPLSGQNQADVTVTVAGIPPDWAVQVDPAAFTLAPGATQEVVILVNVAAKASEDTATLTITASLATTLDICPVGCEETGQTQTATDQTTIALGRSDGTARTVQEALGPWIFVIVFALLAAIALAGKLVVDNRRVTVALHSEDRTGRLKAGGRVALHLQARNVGKADDTVVFQVNPVGDGWAAFLPVPELNLPRGAMEDLHLVVIAPQDALQGARQEVLITATSAQGPRHPASIIFEVTVT